MTVTLSPEQPALSPLTLSAAPEAGDSTPGLPGVTNPGRILANLPAATLVELALARNEGALADQGALATLTGAYTGRSPKDRFIVVDPASKDQIHWGKVNQPLEPAVFERLFQKTTAYLQNRELFVFDGWACADPRHRLPVRVVSEKAWHSLFARCLLLRPTAEQRGDFVPGLTILHACDLKADPAVDGTRSEVFIALNLERGIVLVGGTHYAGEIKKAVFSVLNYLLPGRGVFPMHCSCNVGPDSDTALFFGLSGTGKTTLSADPRRRLIGDDEHGWSTDGVFNIEGGCYAKTIRLSQENEPQIWDAIRFGCVLENVPIDAQSRRPDYDSQHYTENTRAAYPVDFIPNCELSGRGGHPRTVIFLTCDAFGVLPPLSRLTPDQAIYHFLSGYTAKVAGTEAGVTEPEATFSTCFASPFLPLSPLRYAELLRERLQKHQASVWLLNTGWTGGSYGVGHRFPLPYSRAFVDAVLSGALADVPVRPDPVFGLLVPHECPGVPAELLQPRGTWSDPAAYDAKATQLAKLFHDNFKQYEAKASVGVRQAGPRLG